MSEAPIKSVAQSMAVTSGQIFREVKTNVI